VAESGEGGEGEKETDRRTFWSNWDGGG